MTSKINTLSKDERISGEKRIEELFSRGESFISYPLRIVYLIREAEEDVNVSIMVSVSKKKFKRAVKRNRMKRLIRESYRLNKLIFKNICEKNNINLDIAYLYLKNELADFSEIEKAMQKTGTILNEKLRKDESDK